MREESEERVAMLAGGGHHLWDHAQSDGASLPPWQLPDQDPASLSALAQAGGPSDQGMLTGRRLHPPDRQAHRVAGGGAGHLPRCALAFTLPLPDRKPLLVSTSGTDVGVPLARRGRIVSSEKRRRCLPPSG